MALDIPDTVDFDRMANLVDHRSEEPDIEYKTWMDLSTPENRAKIAKHLCAIANYGGGWLIFGIGDDGLHSEPHPEDLSGYTQDVVNSIASRYLHPELHCRVHLVTSKANKKQYPVVRIPPHGAQPICAKTDGPLIEKRRVGVTQGTHYIRVPGPRPAPIDRPDLWQQVLHRCIFVERDKLLASIGRLLSKPSAVPSSSSLDEFADEIINRWSEIQKDGWLVDAKANRTALAFQFLQANGEPVQPISLTQLANGIREASNAAREECDAQSTFNGGTAPPTVVLIRNVEGYQASAIRSGDEYVFAPFLWYALANGVGCEVRPYHEDTDWVRGAVQQRSSRKWPPGERLSPRFQAVRVFEFVTFVRNFSRQFPAASIVRFLIDYSGLAGRRIDDARAGVYYSLDRKSDTESRRYVMDATVETLSGTGTAATTALLLNPILRLFDGWETNANFVHKVVKEV